MSTTAQIGFVTVVLLVAALIALFTAAWMVDRHPGEDIL